MADLQDSKRLLRKCAGIVLKAEDKCEADQSQNGWDESALCDLATSIIFGEDKASKSNELSPFVIIIAIMPS